ncbi:MAG: FlgD immunoglobulin-like domain containing protein, partial [Pseudomonadota bacterium]
GYEIEAQAPLRFDGETPIELRVEPNPDAVAAVLVVRAEDGTVVARTPIDPADTTPVWDGTNSDGDTADPGLYSFAVQRSAGSEALPAETPRGFSLVTEARLENGEVVLVLDGGTTQRAEDVTALRSAS